MSVVKTGSVHNMAKPSSIKNSSPQTEKRPGGKTSPSETIKMTSTSSKIEAKKRSASPTHSSPLKKKAKMDSQDGATSSFAKMIHKEKTPQSSEKPSSKLFAQLGESAKAKETHSSETVLSKTSTKRTKSAETKKKEMKMDEKKSSKSTAMLKSTGSGEIGKQTVTDQLSAAEEFEFFFGKKSPFSQHHPATFQVNGVTYNCAEQYMMHQKAVLFKDAAMARQIMATDDPVKQKKLGRKVQNFDKDRWAKRSLEVVKEASRAKYSQNADLLQKLLATHPRTMVEAAPRDRLWGIGMGASNPKARDPKQWRGRNLLGKILTQVREELLAADGDEKNSA